MISKFFAPYRPVWSDQNMRRLTLANLITSTGTYATAIALPLLVLQVTDSGSSVAWTMLCTVAGSIIGLQVIYPRLHRLHPSQVLRVTEWLMGVNMLLIILASWLPYFSTTVLILALTQNTIEGIWRNTVQFVIKEASEKSADTHAEAFNSANDLSYNLGTVLGPVVMALLFIFGDIRWGLAFDVLTFIISGAILGRISFNYVPAFSPPSIRASLKVLPKFKVLMLLLLPFTLQIAIGLHIAVWTVQAIQVLGASPTEISIVEALTGAAVIFGFFIAPHLARIPFILSFGVLLEALGFLGMYLSKNIWAFGMTQCVYLVGLGISANFLRSSLQRLCSKQEIGPIMGLRLTMIQMAKVASTAFAGVWLLSQTPSTLYLVATIILSFCFFVSIPMAATLRPRAESSEARKMVV